MNRRAHARSKAPCTIHTDCYEGLGPLDRSTRAGIEWLAGVWANQVARRYDPLSTHPRAWLARLLALMAACLSGVGSDAGAVEYESPPISYSATPAYDRVAWLQQALAGGAGLALDARFGYLPALLERLGIGIDSQVLVFSKTSLQKDRIGPENPRALYFDDEVYVAYVPGGENLELAATDPRQGTMFYVLAQHETPPRLVRRTDECLVCHDAQTFTGGVPGLFLRSVFPDVSGLPILKAGTFVTDQQSPFAERWGGWYVTGRHGAMRHLGNLLTDESTAPEHVDREPGANLATLDGRIDASRYLGRGSDLVALLVLAHQTQMHNRITAAGFEVRAALAADATMNQALGRPAGYRSDSAERRITAAGDELVRYLLCSGEQPLPAPVAGSSAFAEHFADHGPRDPLGRSLRDLDLVHRLLRHPCSYLIYSEAFDQLPPPLIEHVYHRLRDILDGHDQSAAFAHLDATERTAIREILTTTKRGLPEWWH